MKSSTGSAFAWLQAFQLRFHGPMEREFQRHHAAKNWRFSQLALLSGILLFACYGVLDIVLADRYQNFLLLFRFAVMLPLLLLAFGFTYSERYREHMQGVLGVTAIGTAAGLSYMICHAFEEIGDSYYFGVIITNFYAQAFARMQFVPSTIAAVSNVLVFNILIHLLIDKLPPTYVITTNYFVISAGILGAVTSYTIDKLERQAFRQNQVLSDSNRELERRSRTDSLTGLPNRRGLSEKLASLERDSQLTGKKFAIALVDIDHFKQINDTFGHECGDIVLRRVALALRRFLRSADVVGRWGGEEFLVIFPHGNGAGARLAALKLNAAIRALGVTHGAEPVTVTATFGVAEGGASEPVDEVIRRADAALYEGKSNGRDMVVLHVDMHGRPPVRRPGGQPDPSGSRK